MVTSTSLENELLADLEDTPNLFNDSAAVFLERKSAEQQVTQSDKESLVCGTCQKTFSRKFSLERHLQLHSVKKSHFCDIDQNTSLEQEFPSHLQKTPDVLNDSAEVLPGTQTVEPQVTYSNKEFSICDTCQKTFTRKSSLNRHLRSYCGKKTHFSDQKTSLEQEFLPHLRKTPNVLNDSAGVHLETHNTERQVTHSNKESYICDTCQKTFTRKYNLYRHLRSHCGKKSQISDIEQEASSSKQDLLTDSSAQLRSLPSCLNQELRVYLEKLPISLNDYSVLVSSKQSFERRVTYSKNESFPCGMCQKVFSTSGGLLRHAFAHSGRNKCDVCQKAFSREDTLKAHLRYHSGEGLFVCDFCQKVFVHYSRLRTHLRTHTAVQPHISM